MLTAIARVFIAVKIFIAVKMTCATAITTGLNAVKNYDNCI